MGHLTAFIIRRAVPGDAERMHQIHVDSIRKLCAADYTLKQIESWVRYRSVQDYRQALEAGELNWVAVLPDEITAGYATFVHNELTALFVDPSYARHGVGKALIETIEQHARQQTLNELVLQATVTAKRFYQRLGYQPVADNTYVLPDGAAIECVRMNKVLK